MDWLQTHLRDFVFPTLVHGRLGMGRVSVGEFKGELRPASGCQFPETGQLKALLQSTGLWKELVPSTQDAFQNLRFSRFPFSHSLETKTYHRGYTHEQIVHTIVKNSVKDLKHRAGSNKVLLLGRDVWLWAVIGKKLGLPHVYDSRVSRNVAAFPNLLLPILEELGTSNNDMVFDTGFAGTIFKRCSEAVKTLPKPLLLKNLMLSARAAETQFPNYQLSRNRALFIEYLPKYFSTGRVEQKAVVQRISELDEFVRASLLTIWAWQYESPSWVRGPSIWRKRHEAKLDYHSFY